MTLKTATTLVVLLSFLFLPAMDAAALTTEELLRLKNAGVAEEVVVYMVESRYDDAEKVCKLKEAGYKDQTLLAIIKSEVENALEAPGTPGKGKNAAPEKTTFQTAGKIKILWHLIYQGKPVVQNKFTADNVTIALIGDNVVRFEWNDKEDLGLLEVFRRRPFRSPFYWEIAGDDIFGPGKDGYPFMLKSAPGHRGRPSTDDAHFWVVYFEPKDARIADHIRKAFAPIR